MLLLLVLVKEQGEVEVGKRLMPVLVQVLVVLGKLAAPPAHRHAMPRSSPGTVSGAKYGTVTFQR